MAKARGKPSKPTVADKKKNLPSHTAGPASPPTLDLSRFTTPQRGYRSSIRWFDQLSVKVQDYLLEVADLFQSGQSTWTVGATFDQLREELGLSTSKATFTSFLRGSGSYRNFKQEVHDARAKTKQESKRVRQTNGF